MSLIYHHKGSCAGWTTGDPDDCNCAPGPDWRIRKDPDTAFPWRVDRRTGNSLYEPVMRCSSYDRAVELVRAFTNLKTNALRDTSA